MGFEIFDIDESLLQSPWSELDANSCMKVIDAIEQIENLALRDQEARHSYEKAVALTFCDRITSNIHIGAPELNGAFADLLLGRYSSAQAVSFEADYVAQDLLSHVANGPIPTKEFTSLVEQYSLASRCSIQHPIFDYISKEADSAELAEIMWAENPCDLNFVNLLGYLMQGVHGRPGIEISNNFFDEIGEGDLEKFHIKMRKQMMRNVGVPSVDEDWLWDSYHLSELRHFNAYCANGHLKPLRFRLIGMMYSTEYLVPSQLDLVVEAWRRNGLNDDDMEYLLVHVVGDVEHGQGWANEVVLPLLDKDQRMQRDVLIGVAQHISILTDLYDDILAALKSGKRMVL